VDTSDRLYDDFIRLFFLHTHRESSVLTNELPEESDQFRFLRAACLANLKGSVDLILVKVSDMRISIPLDLSSRSFIPLSRFIRFRSPTPLLVPSLVRWKICSIALCDCDHSVGKSWRSGRGCTHLWTLSRPSVRHITDPGSYPPTESLPYVLYERGQEFDQPPSREPFWVWKGQYRV
jgi:hypothetical protein